MLLDIIKIPIKIEPIVSSLVLNNGDIRQVIELNIDGKIEHLSTFIYKASEDSIKDALVAMGWTPPKE